MSFYSHSFVGEVSLLHYVPYSYTVIFVPEAVQGELPLAQYPRLRVVGEIAEHDFNAALIPSKEGRHIILSPELLKATGLRLGDAVEVRFNVADQDAVPLPEELEAALASDPIALQAWDELSPGRRRGLAHLVAKPKTAATRSRKAAELAGLLASGSPLPGPPSRSAKNLQPDG